MGNCHVTSLSKWDSPNTHKHYSKLKPPPPLHLCLLSLSKKRLIFSLFLIRAILLIISLLLSMWTTLQYPEYRRKSVPTFKSTKGGRPSKLSSTTLHHAHCLISTGQADTAVDVARILQNTQDQHCSTETIHCGLKKSGLRAAPKKKCPLLSFNHKKARMDFALAHENWTIDDWKRVIWSDGRKWVWKERGERLSDRLVQGTLKFGGGSLMMWGCMGWDGVGYACKIDGRMDASDYVGILEESLQDSLEYWGQTAEDIIFQQDNDPKHTSKKAKAWFNDHDFEVLVWPANSPDLNPIEHLWAHVKRKLAGYETPPQGDARAMGEDRKGVGSHS